MIGGVGVDVGMYLCNISMSCCSLVMLKLMINEYFYVQDVRIVFQQKVIQKKNRTKKHIKSSWNVRGKVYKMDFVK